MHRYSHMYMYMYMYMSVALLRRQALLAPLARRWQNVSDNPTHLLEVSTLPSMLWSRGRFSWLQFAKQSHWGSQNPISKYISQSSIFLITCVHAGIQSPGSGRYVRTSILNTDRIAAPTRPLHKWDRCVGVCFGFSWVFIKGGCSRRGVQWTG